MTRSPQPQPGEQGGVAWYIAAEAQALADALAVGDRDDAPLTAVTLHEILGRLAEDLGATDDGPAPRLHTATNSSRFVLLDWARERQVSNH
ncbi:hypothetical protein [Tomitella gaofuii]|uniref:hypothetical protein n=1 Tax=Tomitella gaofuii TaxID=2760083 RepID=UPI0015F96505|nr:hypothetical protein [Tomitella gaofuii]